MSSCKYFLFILLLLPMYTMAQSDQHYSMFMYNKLLYDPAYAGSRDVLSVNGLYRNQWTGIDGAPKVINVSVDGAVGSYMKPFRRVALGFSAGNELTGVETNNNLRAYYAYRIRFAHSVLSFGLSAGVDLYSAAYSRLTLHQQNDPNFATDVRNAALPAFGTGVYWSGDNFYCSASVPNLLQNVYDKSEVKAGNTIAQQIRGYYAGACYVFTANDAIKIEPQFLARYAINNVHQLPFSCDLNVSAIFYERFLAGITYRTDKSLEAIVHLQASKRINIGYAYDYTLSGLNGYSGGAHELILGYDFVRDNNSFLTPRFIRKF